MEEKRFTVGYDRSLIRSLSFGIGVVIFCLIYMLVLAILKEIEYKMYILIILISLIGLYGLFLYFLMRPRILVQEDVFEYFPRWDQKKTIHLDQITSRRVERGNEFSFFAQSKRNSSFFTIIYYQGNEELFRITTALPNASILDTRIVSYLEMGI